MSVADKIKEKLAAELNPQKLTIIDESVKHAGHAGARPEGESHFRVEVVSSAFEGQNRIARQRLVYKALAEELATDIHALNIDAKTPGEASPS